MQFFPLAVFKKTTKPSPKKVWRTHLYVMLFPVFKVLLLNTIDFDEVPFS